jgi:hypothetical protein
MSRPNSSPLMRMQACVCGERHPVVVVLMGVPVVECPKCPPNSAVYVDQTAEFPKTWYLRQGVKGEESKEIKKKK